MTDSSPPPVFLGFKADGEFVAALDQGRGIKSRSQFVRESVAEKLEAMNIRLPSSAINAPDRTGKGGPKPRINRVMVLNESTKQRYASPRAQKNHEY